MDIMNLVRGLRNYCDLQEKGMYYILYNYELIKIINSSNLIENIPKLSQMSISDLTMIMAKNNFGNLEFFEKVHETLLNKVKFFNWIDIDRILSDMVRVDRVSKQFLG